jgi:hypothetical protein
MEKYKLKDFARWAKKERLSDEALLKALAEMERGLLGDRLGANVYKKRIGIGGKGKRGGVRTILLFRQGDVAVFVYGYAKNEKSDLEPREEAALRTFAKGFLELPTKQREQGVKNRDLIPLKEK